MRLVTDVRKDKTSDPSITDAQIDKLVERMSDARADVIEVPNKEVEVAHFLHRGVLGLESWQKQYGWQKPYWKRIPDQISFKKEYYRLRGIRHYSTQRDSIGIGGSMSDFVNYITASLKSKDVKLVMGWQSKFGVISAKFVARKTKGLPLLSISLTKLGQTAASEAMANLSLELHKSYKILQDSFVKEQERCCQLTQVISAQKQKSQAVKMMLDVMQLEQQRLQKTTETGSIVSSLNSDTSSVTAALNSSDKQPAAEVQSTKVSRVVPAYCRAKVRGVVLRDTEEEEGS